MSKFMARLIFLPFLFFSLESCSNPKSAIQAQDVNPKEPNVSSPSPQPAAAKLKAGWSKNLKVDDVAYDIYIPQNYRNRSIVVLPGWDFPRTSWVEDSPLVKYADQYGYALILPEMLQTLYESSYYPETQLKWNKMPGGEFIKKRFIPEIQKRHNLLKQGENNTLLGLSTGGRGVALIALENPGLFVAGASLSGDFSQENTPEDRLMTAVYGSFNKFPERWKGRDNPMARVSEWKMPLYLAHGTADNIVPEEQSRLFYQALVQSQGNKIQVEYHPIKGAAHDYKFWGRQLPAVFTFFDKIIESR
ncbi:prolyl oligopeptidase family serine peptidase [Microcoleus sp. FACHB-68]|nr:prolyl oligopeptidase family serine peptidase [Microcoleus sp. FACHB-68]